MRENFVDVVDDKLAQDVQTPLQSLQFHFLLGFHKHLLHTWLRCHCGFAQQLMIGGHFAPADHFKSTFIDVILKQYPTLLALRPIHGKEDHTYAVFTKIGEVELQFPAFFLKKFMRSLDDDTGTIPGIGFTTTSSAVLHIGQHGEGVLDQLMGFDAIEIGHQTRATRVFFQLRNVQTFIGLLHMQNCCLINKKYL